MLTAIYYSPMQENLTLVTFKKNSFVVITGKLPDKEVSFNKDDSTIINNLMDTLVSKNYELIGFFNE